MASYSRLEIANKIKAVMEDFVKRNETTWRKNHPPYLKDDLAKLTMDLMAEAWDDGFYVGLPPTNNDETNPYV